METDRARQLGFMAIACAIATGLLLAMEIVAAPAGQSHSLMALTTSSGAFAVAAVLLVRIGRWSYCLNIVGVALMIVGPWVGALLPDGADAAVILPLAGALLTMPEHRGRPLAGMFALAFVAALTGEAAAFLHAGTAGVAGAGDWSQPLGGSVVKVAAVYGVVWWVADRWWSTTVRAERSLTSQRQLLHVNERLQSTLDPQGVFDLIADSLKPVLYYDNLTIYRVDRTARLMRPIEARDRLADLIMGNTFPIDMGITGWVVEHAEAQCLNDAHLDGRAATIPGTADEPESLIVVPLMVHGVVAGTLNLSRVGKTRSHFSAAEFEIARLFAGQASIALQNAEAHRAVWNLAETDALTGLPNRGAFDSRLGGLAGDETAQSCALIMVDLDGFKRYNDRHGHPAGDTVLQAVGQAIDSAIRERDLSFRLGGDEFAILLPRTRELQAARIAERVRLAIKMHPLLAGTLTASVGMSCQSIHAIEKTALVGTADAALYRAKAGGGDRVEAAVRVRPASARRRRATDTPETNQEAPTAVSQLQN